MGRHRRLRHRRLVVRWHELQQGHHPGRSGN